MSQCAHGAGRQYAAAQALGPGFGILLYREVECGFLSIGGRDRTRGVRTVSFLPAFEQPFRGIAGAAVDRLCRGALRHLSQHGVDKARVTRRASVGLRKPYRQIDRCVIRNLKPENLRCTEQQDRFDPRRVGRKALVEKSANQVSQRPKPPQNGCDEPAHQGAVAFGKSG
jgi:hypothetical protein